MADDRLPSISRRRICSAFAVALASPGLATAQRSNVVRRIGVLEYGPDLPEWIAKGRADALARLGWVEGRNLHVERRYNNGQLEAFQSLAEDLLRAKVEIIVTNGTAATLAAKRATTSVPIVFDSAGDAVLLGLVASLARPGGNITGYSASGPEVAAKQLTVLKELLPRVQRVGVLRVARDPYAEATRRQFEQVSRSLGLVPVTVEIDGTRQFTSGIQQLTRQNVQALLVGDDVVSDELIETATKAGLPTMVGEDAAVRDFGALCSYGPTWEEYFRLRAQYVDRILRGAKPAELPVAQPTRFLLAINLRTARSLGLTVPRELLLRADDVIQ